MRPRLSALRAVMTALKRRPAARGAETAKFERGRGRDPDRSLREPLVLAAARRAMSELSEPALPDAEAVGVAFNGGGRSRGTFWTAAGDRDPALTRKDARFKALRATFKELGLPEPPLSDCRLVGGRLAVQPQKKWLRKVKPHPGRALANALAALASFLRRSRGLYEVVANASAAPAGAV